MPHVKVNKFNLYFGNDHILKDIDVSIPDKQITVIIGPSGCGKTTLLKSFNRLIDLQDNVATDGNILIDGEDVFSRNVDLCSIRKKMGLLLQKPYPLPMSIYDNIAYGPRIHGFKKGKDLDGLVEHYLKEASLWDEVKDRLHAPAVNLSLGQQQRLCLARGLAVEPEIILADEPTSALDPLSTARIEKTFIKLKKSYTIIAVTHILRQAKRIADYVIFMYYGRVIEHGPASKVLENPEKDVTKEYVNGVIS